MRRIILSLFALALSARPAGAIEDLLTPRGLAMGSSGRGAAVGALGSLLNPAGIEWAKQYTIEAMYGFKVQDAGSSLHLSITDSMTNAHIGMGAYYEYVHSSPRFVNFAGDNNADVTRTGSEAGLSLALPLGDHFAFGITAKYSNISTDGVNPAAATDKSAPATVNYDSTTTHDAKGFTMDAGLQIKLGESLGIGLVGYNFIPLHSVETPIGIGMGLAYQATPSFMLVADAKIDFDKYKKPSTMDAMGNTVDGGNRTTARIGGGAEYLAGGVVPLRLGYFQDTGLPGGFLSAGIGYLSQTFGLDLAYRQKVSGGNETWLMLGVRVFLN